MGSHPVNGLLLVVSKLWVVADFPVWRRVPSSVCSLGINCAFLLYQQMSLSYSEQCVFSIFTSLGTEHEQVTYRSIRISFKYCRNICKKKKNCIFMNIVNMDVQSGAKGTWLWKQHVNIICNSTNKCTMLIYYMNYIIT